ncbi:MAG TPA: hypothetical protein VJN21_15745 [Candidatus Acidoferrales bacterium]|nr:hypothetical protein [Candidatus Acidoferrales bacterium]
MTDAEFISAFESGSLPNGSFHHRDHVRMAFLFLRRYPPLEALQHFSASLARFASANGKPQLYNETITWAYVLLIRERIARAGLEQSWDEFADANPDLLNWKDGVLKNYYREETLASELAKRVFLFPDKLPVNHSETLKTAGN